jgi:triacylglycerol lipase
MDMEYDFVKEALFHATLCGLTYDKYEDVEDFEDEEGNKVYWIKEKPFRVLLLEKKDSVHISFRGSKTTFEALLSYKAYRVKRHYGKVHKGFVYIWEAIRDLLIYKFREKGIPRSKDIYVTGHSMGGALASLCALYLKDTGWNVKRCWTFGSPKVGGSDWVGSVKKSGFSLIRIVNGLDLVAKVPWWYPYKHAGTSYYIGEDGKFASKRQKSYNPIKLISEGLNDHKIQEYERLLEQIKKDLE